MSKIVVLGGAGGMGSMAVKDLALNGHYSEIVIADINEEIAKQLKNEIDSNIISTAKIDVTKRQDLVELLEDAMIVINFVGPYYKFAPMIIETCIEAKTNYVDICDDYDAVEALLNMNHQVEEA